MPRPQDDYPNRDRIYPAAESDPKAVSENWIHPALEDLWNGRWLAAEQGLTSALVRTGATEKQRALAVVGVAQARLFGRMDARGAFPMLRSIQDAPLGVGQEALWEPAFSARLHVLSAFLFATPEPGIADAGRSRGHAVAARRFLAITPDPDLIGLAAVAELQGALLDRDARTFRDEARTRSLDFDAVRSPVTRCLVLEATSIARLAAGDLSGEEEVLNRALAATRELGFAAAEARVLARLSRRARTAGDAKGALDRLHEAGIALARAGAEGTWVHQALAETARAVTSSVRSTSFAVAATGLENFPTPGERAAPISRTIPAGADATIPSGPGAELARLAPSRATVLLIAGSREKLAEAARALHDRSGRAARPFVEFDCTSRDAEAVENLLFGGPPYGVTVRAAVHEAGTGTLHVSAIDALPVLMQPRFLRFLDATDRPRVVVSTSADLRELTKIGTMRADLSERLLLVQVRLPGAP